MKHITGWLRFGSSISVLVTAALALLPLPSHAQSVTPRRTWDFLDSQGINIRLDDTSGPYNKFDTWVKPRLAELKMRHVRSQYRWDYSNVQPRALSLASSGIKSTLYWHWNYDMSSVRSFTEQLAGALDAIEGPNESDIEGINYQGFGWPEGTRRYQRDLYNTLKGSSNTTVSNLPIILTSVSWGRKLENPYYFDGNPTPQEGLGNMETWYGSPVMTHGSGHWYSMASQNPEQPIDDWHLYYSRKAAPTKPLILTECGYNTTGVTETTQANYNVRLYLEHFRRDISRTFLFSLYDGPDGGFGLLRNNNATRPSFQIIKNMNAILFDSASNASTFSTGSFDYTASGTTANTRSVLLRKANGKFYMVWWNAVPSGNGSQWIRINFNTLVASSNLYRPANGTGINWSSPTNPTFIDMEVTEAPVIIEITQR